jgi:hypothetical protein
MRNMSRHTVALVSCLFFLVLAELGARAITDVESSQAAGGSEEQRCVLVGGSRTMRGLRPSIMEAELTARGVPHPWVGIVAQRAVKLIGLHQLYMEQVHPLAVSGAFHGVLAIAVGPSALNDNATTEEEHTYMRLAGIDVRPDPASASTVAATARNPVVAAFQDLRRGDPGAASRTLLGASRLVQEKRPLLRAVDARLGKPAVADTAHAEWDVPWAQGEKGWLPFHEPRPDDLFESMWRKRYRELLLRNFSFGKEQSYALIYLIRQAKADGLEPVLYTMPVTDIQVGFYDPGDYQAGLEQFRAIAVSEGVPYIDLETNHGIPYEMFHDTHHIGSRGVDMMSRRFADRVLLPLLEERTAS